MKKLTCMLASLALVAGTCLPAKSELAGASRRNNSPTLVPSPDHSTYLGGSGDDQVRDIALDAFGNIYVTGSAGSFDFPTSAGALDTTPSADGDAFVTKFDPSGNLVYSTYLGGSGGEFGTGIAVDSSGSAYVIGITDSPDFPATVGAFDTTLNSSEIFVAKLNPSGNALEYSTFLGGQGSAPQALGGFNNDIVVDAQGSAYVSGITEFGDFPTTPGAFDTTPNSTQDGFVAKLNPSGSALVYSTYLGGSGSNWPLALAVDSSGSVYVTGSTTSSNFPVTPGAFDTATRGGFTDAFVTKLDPSGSALVYSTFLGGEDDDQANSIAVDSSGNAYVTGSTESSDFPVTPCAFDRTRGAAQDLFVTKLNPTGAALEYSTYLGGTGGGAGHPVEEGDGIAVDPSGSAIITGVTRSPDFPTTSDAFDPTFNGATDVFVTRLHASGNSITYSSFLGGSGDELAFDIALDGIGGAYLAGRTSSPDFPVTPGAYDVTFGGGFLDAFMTRMSLPPEPPVPATIQLTPPSAESLAGTSHTVTASVGDQFGNPFPNVTVRFNVTGATTASGTCNTDAGGLCAFSYQGPATRGTDTISAFADANADGVNNAPCEPSGQATKTWLSAADDFASTDEDNAVTINVLANDAAPNGNSWTLTGVTQGANGSVVINPDYTVTYSPAADFNGTDSFTYTVTDTSGNTDTATVTVFVRPVNDPPVAHDGSAATDEDVPVQINLSATDVDSPDLAFAIVSGPSNGTLSTVNGSGVVYTPDPDFNGSDSFTFRANEVVSEPPPEPDSPDTDRGDFTIMASAAGSESNVATVSITVAPVADAPVLATVGNQMVAEGAPLSFALSASDPDGEQLTFSATGLPSGATLDPATGAFSWTPTFEQAGLYTVTFSATDPTGRTASETITITVNDVVQNLGPVCSSAYPSLSEIWPPDHYRTELVSIFGITDPDNDPLTIIIRQILQDEPTNTHGDGSTWIDGGGLGTSQAWVRAERSGAKKVSVNGRIYEIYFDASDGRGNSCTGSVKVGVPHDQGRGPAVDDGRRFDSTVANGPCLNCNR